MEQLWNQHFKIRLPGIFFQCTPEAGCAKIWCLVKENYTCLEKSWEQLKSQGWRFVSLSLRSQSSNVWAFLKGIFNMVFTTASLLCLFNRQLLTVYVWHQSAILGDFLLKERPSLFLTCPTGLNKLCLALADPTKGLCFPVIFSPHFTSCSLQLLFFFFPPVCKSFNY